MKSSCFPQRAAMIAALGLLSTSAALSQTVTGSISGTVTDPSGAVIPKATVVALNTGTGVRTPVTSNNAGEYSLRFLPIGTYQVEVTAPGFTKLTIPPFALEINQTAKVDAHVSLGTTTQVEVQGNLTPILDTSDATLGLSLNADEIATVPLNGRNFSSLSLYQPGAVATDPNGLTGSNGTQRDTYNSGVVTINGNRAQDNNYTLDGIDINETQNNLIGYNPAPDALAEVRVISANAPATYGNVNGGDIVSVLKSGTNKFHGSAYEYLENQNLSANTWANNFSRVGQTPFTQSLFGGTLGGPIFRNKLFFFVDYEGTRQHQGGNGTASVLSTAMRGGDFSALPMPTASTPGIVLVDPQKGYAPFANNQGVPINNPVVKYLLAHPEFYPLPNQTATDGLIQNNFIGPTSSFVTNNQGDVKIEYDPRQADKITAFYSQGISNGASLAPLAITFPNSNTYPDHLGGVTWTRTFSPAIVNEARFGFTRIRWDSNIPTDTTGAFGTNGDSIVGIPTPAPQQFAGFTYQGFSNATLTGVGVPGQAQVIRDNTYSLGDILTIQRGRHLFSLGGELLRYQQNFAQYGSGGQLGTYSFSGQNSSEPGASGYGPVDWLLDRADQQQISLSNGFFGDRQWRIAGFAQDDWKVSDRLTVNLGLRYEFDTPYTEAHNQLANVILSGAQMGTVEYADHVPAGAAAGSVVCSNPGCYNPDYTEFQPRVGFAFQASPRIVFRGGYGTTSFLEGSSGLPANPPFNSFSSLSSVAPSSLTNPGTFFAEENGFQVGANSQSIAGYTAYTANYQQAFLEEYNFNTEIQLNNTTSAQFGYVGEIGHHLIDFRNANQLTTAQAAAAANLPTGAALPAADVAPFAGLVGQNGELELFETEGVSTYNALQITVRHRISKGFQATVNYTWAKSLTDTNGNYGASGSDGPFGIQDGNNLHGDYGPSELDTRNNLSANGSYAIPFGRGQQFGSNTNRVLDLLAGGWTLSATAYAYSGLPITIFSPHADNTNSLGDNFGSERANQYRTLQVVGRSVAHWFGTDPSAAPCTGMIDAATGTNDNKVCAYGTELPYTFGTAKVGTERAPGFEQVDASLFKDFHITEGQSVGFRADAFNVMNLVSYNNPDSNVGDSNFGQITSSKSTPRTIQFAAHYSF